MVGWAGGAEVPWPNGDGDRLDDADLVLRLGGLSNDVQAAQLQPARGALDPGAVRAPAGPLQAPVEQQCGGVSALGRGDVHAVHAEAERAGVQPPLPLQRRHVERPGGGLQPQGAPDELLRGERARPVAVQQREEALGLRPIYVEDVEKLGHVGAAQLAVELRQGDDLVAGAVPLRGGNFEDLLHAPAQQALALRLVEALGSLHEDASHEVHDHHDCEGDVQEEQEHDDPCRLLRNALQGHEQRGPVDTTRRRGEEVQHRAAHRAVVGRQLITELSVPLWIVGGAVHDKLRQEDAKHVGHRHQQDHCPDEGSQRCVDKPDQLVELLEELEQTQHPQDTGQPQEAHQGDHHAPRAPRLLPLFGRPKRELDHDVQKLHGD
mmetsp:Transcript_19226/g.51658  ORF Transcript_19226/g.51658 Transcript_19226/m.51658 type:complete len:378 (+) Transcript_19226:87-1220(+)